MNLDDQDHLLLAAYLDGELSPGEVLEIERRLKADPDLRKLMDDLTELSKSVRHVVSETTMSAARIGRISDQLAKVEVRPRRREWQSWNSLAAALLLGVFVGGLSGYGLSKFSTSQGEAPIENEIFASHLRGLAASQPFDIASSDRHTVKPWFNGRTSIAPDVPDLNAQGFPLVGGRVDIVAEKPVPTLVYRRRQHVISLTAVPATDDKSERSVKREGTRIEQWRSGDLTYFAASDLNAKELADFGALFRSATAPAAK